MIIQGSGVCEREEVCKLAEGCSGLGHLKEPILGDPHPTVDQRRRGGGMEERVVGGGGGVEPILNAKRLSVICGLMI